MKTQTQSNTVDSLIVDLVRDVPQLKLTGSRFFGNSTQYSDWDFMLDSDYQDNLPLDFLPVPEPLYTECDPWITQVMHSAMRNCHVQIVSDLILKLDAQEILQRTGALIGLNKMEKRAVWQAVCIALDRATR